MVSFFVPAYNEEKNINNTVNDILSACKETGINKYEIIIVNDGSKDNTKNIVIGLQKQYPEIQLINNDINSGLGYSFKRALDIAQFQKFFFIAGDNDMSQSVIQNLLLNKDKAELILVYFINREIRGRKRNLISTIYNVIYMMTYGIFVQYINGGVVYSTEKLKNLALHSNRFSIIIEATIKFLKSGCSFYEVSGYMQRGIEGSSALTFKNLVEVFLSYFRLIIEVKIKLKELYNKNPVRMYNK